MRVSELLRQRSVATIASFGLLAVIAAVTPSPWWDGPLLDVTPVLPTPSGDLLLAVADDAEPVEIVPLPQPDAVPEAPPTEAWHPDPADVALREGLQAILATLPAPVPIERPCRDPAETDDCGRRALDRLYARLRDVALGRATEPVRISQLGDSLIAGDGFTGALRALLQAQLGDGGPGWVHAGPADPYLGLAGLWVSSTEGWDVRTVITDRHGRFGMGGAVFRATGAPTLSIRPKRRVTSGQAFDHLGVLFERAAAPGALRLTIDGVTQRVDLAGPPGDAVVWVDVPDGRHDVRLRGFSAGEAFYAVLLERSGSGVVVDNLGLTNARAPRLLLVDDDVLRRQLALRGTDLLAFAYGVNSATTYRPKDDVLEENEHDYREVLGALREPGREPVDCLVVGLLTRGVRVHGEVKVAASVPALIARQRAAALASGCAFWDAHAAIGGEEGTRAWATSHPIRLGADLSHPTAAGYDALARRLYAALVAGLAEHVDGRLAPPDRAPEGEVAGR